VTSGFNPSASEKKSMYLKIHQTPKGKIVASCDQELLGTVLDDGRIYLDLKTHKSFYSGSLASANEHREALGNFVSANLVGKRSVAVAIEMNIANKEDVMYINKTPHIQLYRI